MDDEPIEELENDDWAEAHAAFSEDTYDPD